jgi:hypothetical protein
VYEPDDEPLADVLPAKVKDTEATVRRKARALAAQHGIEIETERWWDGGECHNRIIVWGQSGVCDDEERDPFYGRLPDLARFNDVLTLVGQPENEGSTHPEADPAGYQRIDHVFVSGDLVGSVIRAWIDTQADGSDHQPVFAELSFP